MKLDDLLAALEKGEFDTPVTPLNPRGVSAKAAPEGTYTPITPVTPITPPKSNMRGEVRKPAGVTYGTTSHWWRVHYSNRGPKEASYWPPVNEDEALEGEPEAISAEPFEPIRRQPDEPLSENEEIEIREWLTYIGETDEAMITVALEQCRTDADAREAFLWRRVKRSDSNAGC